MVAAQGEPFCSEGLDTLSIGDIYLTSDNYNEFKNKTTLFVAGFSSSKCPSCCQTESLLKKLQGQFKEGGISFFGEEIPVARVDISQNISFLANDTIILDKLPQIFIVMEGNYYTYEGSLDNALTFISHLNRIVHPVLVLKTKEEVKSFTTGLHHFWKEDLDTPFLENATGEVRKYDGGYEKMTMKTRVVAYIQSPNMMYNIPNLMEAAQTLAHRENLRIALVTNRDLINDMRKNQKDILLKMSYQDGMTLLRPNGEEIQLSFHSYNRSLSQWISKVSLLPNQHISLEAWIVLKYTREPTIITFMDTQSDEYREESLRLDEAMDFISDKYTPNLNFVKSYTGNQFPSKYLGFEWESLPGMLLLTTDNRIVEYPDVLEFNQEEIELWIKALLEGRLTDFGEEQKVLMPDTQLQEFMNETQKLNSFNYRNLVGQNNTDCLVFLYSSGKQIKSQWMMGFQTNLVAKIFNNLNLTYAFPVYTYDINFNAFPETIPFQQHLPLIYFYPATKKQEPPIKYTGKPYAGHIIMFIQQHSVLELELPLNLKVLGMTREDIDREYPNGLGDDKVEEEKAEEGSGEQQEDGKKEEF